MQTIKTSFFGLFDTTSRKELYNEIEALENERASLQDRLRLANSDLKDLREAKAKKEQLLRETEVKYRQTLADNTRLADEINTLKERISELQSKVPNRGMRGRFVKRDKPNKE